MFAGRSGGDQPDLESSSSGYRSMPRLCFSRTSATDSRQLAGSLGDDDGK